MKKISDFLSIASGAFAVVPGIAILTTNVGVPPNCSKALFGGIVEALGVFTLLIIWLNKDWIKSLAIEKINKMSLISIFLFVASLFGYIFLYNYLVVGINNPNPIFFPLWATGELKNGIEQLGSREELLIQWGRDDVYKVIQSSSNIPLLLTTLIMLFLYQLTFASLTFSFGLLAVKSSGNEIDE